jgi:phosphate uptake regulator
MWKNLIRAWRSDSLIEAAWQASFEMLGIDRRMFREAVRILRESDDVTLNEDIRQLDRKVNKYERDVRRKVMTHCTLTGPSELSSGMILVSVVIDIERIGDYCKNILELAQSHPQRLVVGEYEASIADVEQEAKARFDRTIEVLRGHDVGAARQLMGTYRTEISQICDQIVSDMVQGRGTGMSPGDTAALALYARYLKRISAHLNNMVTSVVNPFDRIGFREKPPKDAS